MKNIFGKTEIPKEFLNVFKIEVTKNEIKAYNYKKIKKISSDEIILSNCLIKGKKMKLTKLLHDDLIILGQIEEIKLGNYENL